VADCESRYPNACGRTGKGGAIPIGWDWMGDTHDTTLMINADTADNYTHNRNSKSYGKECMQPASSVGCGQSKWEWNGIPVFSHFVCFRLGETALRRSWSMQRLYAFEHKPGFCFESSSLSCHSFSHIQISTIYLIVDQDSS